MYFQICHCANNISVVIMASEEELGVFANIVLCLQLLTDRNKVY